MLDKVLRALLPSVIRTVVPVATGLVLTAAAVAGLDIDKGIAEDVAAFLITGAWFAFARSVELASPKLGRWLLSLGTVKAQPVYVKPTPPPIPHHAPK